MTGYLTLGIAAIALVGIALAGIQSVRLSDARAGLATVQSQLTDARRDRDQAVRDRHLATRAMTAERDAALQAEMEASGLRELIARDAGTARDGETAPVLRETLERLRGSGLGSGDQLPTSHRSSPSVSDLRGGFHP